MSFPRRFLARHISTKASLVRLLMLSIFLVPQGCTTSPLKPWAPHVAEDVRATIRTIGVAVTVELPLVAGELRVTVESLSEYTTTTYARLKAWEWSKTWLDKTQYIPPIFWFSTVTAGAMLVLTPVVAAAGAVAGAIEAPSDEEAQVHSVFKVGDLVHRLQNQVLTQVTERTDISVATILGTAPNPLGGRETVSASGVSQPDAILRIQLKSIDLRGSFDVDPLLALNLEVQVTLIAPSASTPLYTHPFHYVTGARRLTEWRIADVEQGSAKPSTSAWPGSRS